MAVVYSVKIRVQKGQEKPRIQLESRGFIKRSLGDICPLKDVVYLGDGRLRIGKGIEQTLKGSFGFIFGFDEDNCLLIYRDRLGTFPLFMFEDAMNKELVFFNRFYLVEKNWSEFTVDKVGFWETVLYESTLGSRSLFDNVLQMPCASKIRITPDLGYDLKKYWFINYDVNNKLTRQEFLQGSYERFDRVFSKLDRDKKYVLPISGGVDSRIVAAFMAKYIPKENVSGITYGYDRRLLEYVYSGQVMSALNYDVPDFHQLTYESYSRNLEPMARMTGGCISIQNAHLFDYLCNSDGYQGTDILCCSPYSDGILGFDATGFDIKTDSFDDCAYYNRLNTWGKQLGLPNEVANAIRSDLEDLFIEWQDNSSISSIDEYVYLVERNNKFHSLLADLAREYSEVFLPFTDPDLVDYYLSAPNVYRFRKQGTIDMTDQYFPAIKGINTIGSLFGVEGFKRPVRFTQFRIFNFINYLAAVLTRDKIHFVNPYQTERHGYNLRKYCRSSLDAAVDYLVDQEIVDDFAVKGLKIIPARDSINYVIRYQMINGAYVMKLMKGVNLFD